MTIRLTLAMMLAAGLLLPACTAYTPRPLDAPNAQAAWLARAPADADLQAFAERLGAGAGADAAVFDPADGLSLPEAEVVALFYNPALRVARLRAGVTRAQAKYAGLWSDPTLSVNGERVLASVEHPWIIGGTLGLTLPLSGRLSAEKARAGAAHAAELARVAELEWAARAQLRREWVRWSAALEHAAVLEAALTQVESVGAIVTRLEQAGELGRLDARAFQMEALSRRAELASARAQAVDGELALRGLMGLSPAPPLVMQPTLAIALADSADEDAALLEARSPALAVLAAEYEAAEKALQREVRAQYPDLTIGPGASREDGETRALLGLSLPIPLWNRNRGGVAEAMAEREAAGAAYEARTQELTIELAQARAGVAAARARRETLEQGLIPLAEAQEQDARRVAELGGVSTLLMLDTLARVASAKTQLIEARAAESLAAVRVGALLGPPAPPTQSEPTAPADVRTTNDGEHP